MNVTERMIYESAEYFNIQLHPVWTKYLGSRIKNYPMYAKHLYDSIPETYRQRSAKIDPISPEDAPTEYFFQQDNFRWKVITRKNHGTKYEVIGNE